LDQVTKEIRQMLLGNLVTEGKYLTVSPSRLEGLRYGINDGADTVILRGVMKHTRYYKSNLAKGKIKESAHNAMMDIGRKVLLQSNPEAETIICRYMVTKPIVLLFEVDDIGIKVQTFTARSLSGLISEAWIRARFMKRMPDELEPINKEIIKSKIKEKEKEQKAEEEKLKAEKKKQKEEEKAQKEKDKAQKAKEKDSLDIAKKKLKEEKKRAKIEKKLAKLGATATWIDEDPLAGEKLPEDVELEEALDETAEAADVAEAVEETDEAISEAADVEETDTEESVADDSEDDGAEAEDSYEPEDEPEAEEEYDDSEEDDEEEYEDDDDDSEDDEDDEDAEEDEYDGEEDENAGGYASQNDLPSNSRARNFNEEPQKKGWFFGKKH
jgi:hypothetical protein